MKADVARGGAVATLLAALTTAGFAAPANRLQPSEIQATFFNGQPFTASTTSNLKFKMTFTADGKIKREPIGPGKGNKGEGTWKLSKDGFCTTWSSATLSNCFTLVSSGDNKWSVLKGSSIQAIWTK
jgi:hypothetical protein